MEILVSKGELATILGVINYATARLALKQPGCMLEPVGLPGAAVIELLDLPGNIDLGNPEVVQLCDLLVFNGIIPTDARARITDYIQGHQFSASAPTTRAHNYRVPLANVPVSEGAIVWVSQFMTADHSAWVDGEWILVATDGACTAPGTEVMA